ncbi:MAG: type II 3-dehydroquinate dehydratase [Zetaproteobacteria bacterium CG2_30_46_52]|nr:MAG: type II 3-dehydroquinate dehydratase [Zetaproteobacteria bacterium CG2_30_46_52]
MSNLNIQVIHGPNLNMLGSREPGHYGTQSLADINEELIALGDKLNVRVTTFQSNHEGEIVDKIQQLKVDGLIINPAAYTHTSIAIRDALLAVKIPFIEVHLSNIHRREDFRHKSMLVDVATAVVAGFGAQSYSLALRGLHHKLTQETNNT